MPRPRKADQLADLADLRCDDQLVHLAAVQQARRSLPATALLAGVTDIFAALSDPTRLRIVAALATHELCVCDLAASVGLSESAISHQLRTLRMLGLVRPRRAGRLVYYALDDAHVSSLFELAVEHVSHRQEGAA